MTLAELTSRIEALPPGRERARLEALQTRLIDRVAGATRAAAHYEPRDVSANLPIQKGQP